METAIFAAGCFWGVESAFAAIPGVVATKVGYIGGKRPNPTYENVCSGATGHAEAVEVVFEPAQIAYEKLVQAFFELHDPTQVNRQGPDVGDQYRSAIFFTTPQQEQIAKAAINALNLSGKLSKPVATKLEPAPTFWAAEDYHQKYFAKRGGGSCHI